MIKFSDEMKKIFDGALIFIMFVLLVVYGIDIKKKYPEFVLDVFQEPLFKLFAYSVLYFTLKTNFTLGVLVFLLIIFAHIDILILTKKPVKENFEYGPPLHPVKKYEESQEKQDVTFYPLN